MYTSRVLGLVPSQREIPCALGEHPCVSFFLPGLSISPQALSLFRVSLYPVLSLCLYPARYPTKLSALVAPCLALIWKNPHSFLPQYLPTASSASPLSAAPIICHYIFHDVQQFLDILTCEWVTILFSWLLYLEVFKTISSSSEDFFFFFFGLSCPEF